MSKQQIYIGRCNTYTFIYLRDSSRDLVFGSPKYNINGLYGVMDTDTFV
jgi:hypothetical protein